MCIKERKTYNQQPNNKTNISQTNKNLITNRDTQN